MFRDDEELLSIAKQLGPPSGAPEIADIIYFILKWMVNMCVRTVHGRLPGS